MRACILALLVEMVICAPPTYADDGITINNARHLIDTDWGFAEEDRPELDSRGRKTGNSVGAEKFLSFRPGQRWDEGSLWSFVVEGRTTPNGSYALRRRAYKGRYKLSAFEDAGEVTLHCHFTFERKYTIASGGEWELDRYFYPEGATFELTLEEGNAIPRYELTFSITDCFYVDGDGLRTVRRYAPDGLLQSVTGQGSVRKLRDLDFASVGKTLRMRHYMDLDESLSDSPPPTYRARSR